MKPELPMIFSGPPLKIWHKVPGDCYINLNNVSIVGAISYIGGVDIEYKFNVYVGWQLIPVVTQTKEEAEHARADLLKALGVE